MYFERCFAADFDPSVPVEERRACWQAWLAHYQNWQPPDRVDYVRERLLQLDPERAAVIALATGEGGTAPDSITETAPVLAAEARPAHAAAAGTELSASSDDGSHGSAAAPDAQHPVVVGASCATGTSAIASGAAPSCQASPVGGDGVDHGGVDPPRQQGRSVPSARERRMARRPILPRSEAPLCPGPCQPRWEDCVARCEHRSRDACLQACRLTLRMCSRACY